ncbi:MAG: DUF502 domain-containing protein [Candidatus Omnitrophica bacterium]|nr:DUF502 domain-containing protein [Candidatus Omnitrophota bacterium]
MKTKIRRYFIAGIVVLLPLFITVNFLSITIRFFDNLLGRYINPYLQNTYGTSFFGLGLVAIIVLIFFTGIMATNVFVKKIMPYFENLFLRIPFVYQIYPSVKQLVNFLFSDEKLAFKKVVLFEYPRDDVYTMGFLTNEFSDQTIGDKTMDTVCVYISSAPNPITGFFVIVPQKDIIVLDISVEEAIKIIISGGVLMDKNVLSKVKPAQALQNTPLDAADK